MGDVVGFRPEPKLDQEHTRLRETLDVALDEGLDVLTPYEYDLVRSLKAQLFRQGNEFVLSENQREALFRIQKRLDREGLL